MSTMPQVSDHIDRDVVLNTCVPKAATTVTARLKRTVRSSRAVK